MVYITHRDGSDSPWGGGSLKTMPALYIHNVKYFQAFTSLLRHFRIPFDNSEVKYYEVLH